MNTEAYVTDDAHGENWHFMLGDTCERINEIPKESVALSVYSPPFQSLFTYSPSIRDMGNSNDREEFFEQYSYIIRGNLDITIPGGLCCVHVQQTTTTKATHGEIGLTDFRGDVIRAYQKEGWTFFGEVTVDKDPQAQAIRTKAHALMFVTKNKDSSSCRPALADYLLIFKKHGERYAPIPHEANKGELTNEEWIEWARPIWYGIRETNTLNARIAREDDDEKHLTPLQLDFIERCIKLYSRPGETVFTAFGGVGSELYEAVKLGRKAIGIELKPSYWETGCKYLHELEYEMSLPNLFDLF